MEAIVLVVLDELGCDRVIWCSVTADVHTREELVLCGVYAAPGGDVETWAQVRDEYYTVKCKRPNAKVIILGDFNAHVHGLLDHKEGCRCAHCLQCADDKVFERIVLEMDVVVRNPPKPRLLSQDDPY